jgi:hypothetical protein
LRAAAKEPRDAFALMAGFNEINGALINGALNSV